MISLHILISWTLLLTMVFLRYSHAQCTGPWYGIDCEKMCRCEQDSCNTDGTCGEGSTCSLDWFGPSCQYKDFASVNAREIPSWLNDNDMLTCQPHEQSRKISMSFSPAIPFTWLRMDYRQIGNFSIKFNHDTLDCLYKRTYVVSSTETDVSCELSTDVDQISVYGDLVGFLCNIYVSGGRNMALRQPTNQSSTFNSSGQLLTSDKAVDGNLDTQMENCSFTNRHDSRSEKWHIFYRRPVFLHYIHLYNRDTDLFALDGFMMETYGINNERLQSYKEPGSEKDMYYVSMTARSQPVSHLLVESDYEDLFLYICEIETYGDMACTEGKWGPYCEHNCSCEWAGFCSSITGKCSRRCSAGFYGPSCDQSCSASCDNQGCHYVTGECFQCVPGYMGLYCDVACPTGTYGVNCSTPCSDKCLNSECQPTNGSCLSCPPKFYGIDCSTPCSDKCLNRECQPTNGNCLSCSDKFYGNDCSQPCSYQCDGELCYAQSGVCKACKIGFFTDLCDVPCNRSCEDMTCNRDTGYCDSDCPPGKYGPNCALDCPQNCDVCNDTTCFTCSKWLYGDDCSSICPQNCGYGICEMKTGLCLSCVRGFYGDQCEEKCPTECEGSGCDFQTGKCDTSRHRDIISAAAIAVFLLFFTFIGCLILFRSKRHQPPSTEERQVEYVPRISIPKIIRSKSVPFLGTWV